MKRKTTFLVSFLLVLCISSMVFVSAYDSVMIVDPNAIKDFTLSDDGDTWLYGWDYRRTISITGSAGAGTLYQVSILVSYDSDMEIDFDDIRFTDNDGSTLLHYWRESYTASSYALFWVNVTDDLGSNQDIYIYYGNSTVSTTSDGEDTFLFFEDWSSQTVAAARWDVVEDTGSSVTFSATDANHGYVARLVGTLASSYYHIETDYNAAALTSTIFRSRIELTAAANHQRLRQGSGSWVEAFAVAVVASNQDVQQFTVSDDDSNYDDQAVADGYFDSYWRYEITRDGTNARLYADDSLVATGSCDPDITTSNPAHMIYVRDTEHELYSDWIVVRKFIATEPEAGAFGDEELYSEWSPPPPIAWQEVGEAIFYFNVHFDYWGFNMILIFGGLVLMIVSVCMMAVKVRDRTITQDSGMLLLFLFCVGWGLFIGGTLIG